MIEANQERPYKLIKSKVMNKCSRKQLMEIILANFPELKPEEIISYFKELAETGCTCASLANAIGLELIKREIPAEELRLMFGFSPIDKKTGLIDCNKIMADIFLTLKAAEKITTVKYDYYAYPSAQEAVKGILGIEAKDDTDALIKLFEARIQPDGFTKDNLKRYKNNNCKVVTTYGTPEEIGKAYSLSDVKDIKDLQEQLESKEFEVKLQTPSIPMRLGTFASYFNEWNKYYSDKRGLPFVFEQQCIPSYGQDEEEFYESLDERISNGEIITMSALSGDEVNGHTKKPLSWLPMNEEHKGHSMVYKGRENKELLVSSWGEEYRIPQYYLDRLAFYKLNSVSKTPKTDTIANNNNYKK